MTYEDRLADYLAKVIEAEQDWTAPPKVREQTFKNLHAKREAIWQEAQGLARFGLYVAAPSGLGGLVILTPVGITNMHGKPEQLTVSWQGGPTTHFDNTEVALDLAATLNLGRVSRLKEKEQK